jgi:hypothetical protein
MCGKNRCYSMLGHRLLIYQKYMNIFTELAVKSAAGKIIWCRYIQILSRCFSKEP